MCHWRAVRHDPDSNPRPLAFLAQGLREGNTHGTRDQRSPSRFERHGDIEGVERELPELFPLRFFGNMNVHESACGKSRIRA